MLAGVPLPPHEKFFGAVPGSSFHDSFDIVHCWRIVIVIVYSSSIAPIFLAVSALCGGCCDNS